VADLDPTRFVCNAAKRVKPSATREVFRIAAQIQGAISLAIGEPDFDTPAHIREAGKKALEESFTHYTASEGIPELRKAICQYYSKYGVAVAPEEVMVSAGSGQALFQVMGTFLDPGDEALVFDPSYLNYWPVLEYFGAKAVSVPLDEKKKYAFSKEELEKRVTKKSKLMIVCSPNNPTGTVLDKKALEEIADVAIKNDLLVVSDEIYSELLYDDAKFVAMASLGGMKERTITVNGFSKAYAMTGWRLGYAIARREFISEMVKIQGYVNLCPNSITQKAGVAALTGPQDVVEKMRREYDRRRKVVVDRIRKLPDMSVVTPKGAFYVFPNISKYGVSSVDFCKYMATNAKVLVTPGSAFGNQGEGHFRISYAASLENINEAFDRIEKSLPGIRAK
jgi:aminotransferase